MQVCTASAAFTTLYISMLMSCFRLLPPSDGLEWGDRFSDSCRWSWDVCSGAWCSAEDSISEELWERTVRWSELLLLPDRTCCMFLILYYVRWAEDLSSVTELQTYREVHDRSQLWSRARGRLMGRKQCFRSLKEEASCTQ